MDKMTLEELLIYEQELIKKTNDDNAEEMTAILNELDIYKRNLRDFNSMRGATIRRLPCQR